MDGITLKELKAIVDNGVRHGYGNKVVLLSDDDEGNGYHTLFFGLTTNKKDVAETLKYAFDHDGHDPKDVVILG